MTNLTIRLTSLTATLILSTVMVLGAVAPAAVGPAPTTTMTRVIA